jgi:hypothetical protein
MENLVQLASRHGFASVRLYNRITGKLFEDGQLDLNLKVEEYWHSVRNRLPLTLLCSYRGESLSPEKHARFMGEVLGRHTHFIPSGRAGWGFTLGTW